jgi:SAM-dependent methyltransferase
MEMNDVLAEVIQDESRLRLVDEDIYSVLPAGAGTQIYDRRGAAYDWLLSRRAYNRFVWGASPDDYAAFARKSIDSIFNGPHLDAGCGTLLFTAETYLQSDRPIIALDLSLGMLRQARRRIIELAGQVPENVVFLQGDLLDLPFRPSSFASILSMGMIHLFGDGHSVIEKLAATLEEEGELYLTSLVAHNRIGDRYLRLLHRAGEVGAARTAEEFQSLLSITSVRPLTYTVTGNMAYAVLAHSFETADKRALLI